MHDYEKGSVRSSDGTIIGYRRLGSGPPLILVHGGMQASQNLMKLAGFLAEAFTVYVPDRRGRGMSGRHGDQYSITREVNDLQALATTSGASRIFGLSSGALIVLRAALSTPALERIALYEPPLSVRGSVPTKWTPQFDREIAAGRTASALASVMKGLGTEPLLGSLPRLLLVPLLTIGARLQSRPSGDDVAIAELAPTQSCDVLLVREMVDTAEEFASLATQVLLLGGTDSPPWLGVALDALAAALPHARRVTLTGLGHSGPDNDGDPRRVAEVLRALFGQNPATTGTSHESRG